MGCTNYLTENTWLAEKMQRMTGVNDSLLRGQDFFLCLLVRLLIPPKRGVDFKALCPKFSRSLRKDSTLRPGRGFTLSIRIIAICLLSSVVKVACEVLSNLCVVLLNDMK